MFDYAEFGSKWKYFFFRDSLVNGRQYISDMKKGNNLWLFVCFVCLGLTSFLTPEIISRQCLLVAVILPHRNMPHHRHRTWHPAPAEYTDTGPTYRCVAHWCGTSHWNTQLPILMSWVRPDRETFRDLLGNAQLYDVVMVVVSLNLGKKYRV